MRLNENIGMLTESIKTTREFIELKKAKENINQHKELKNELDDFQKRQKEIGANNKPSKQLEIEMVELNKRFNKLSKIPEVARFLKAGKEFNNMMGTIYKKISDSLESEL
jgi:cell fate (sporulation/competence/biofilm development) regulator YlbF (YheA/YmcA/DUF963 family)